MKFANIIVDISHEKLDRPFGYIIPENLIDNISVGTAVKIPFGKGNRLISGYVIELTDKPGFDIAKMKEIHSVIDDATSVESELIKLAWWIKENYGSTMNQALKTVLPVKKTVRNVEKKTVMLNLSDKELEEKILSYQKKNAKARIRLLEELKKTKSLSKNLVVTKLNISASTLKAMEQLGDIIIESDIDYRQPVKLVKQKEYDIVLNKQQRAVVESIKETMDFRKQKKPNVHLIHGITGSGKTEVYMELIDYTIRAGKDVIVLIPEIALTYQTVMRFTRRFGNQVSIINSRLSKGERYDQFERAKKGDIHIMIGPRSALFTPFKNLGLIVIDEEHENAYKSESVPKYHAVEVAIKRARDEGATLVLGSATPSIESYYRAKNGVYGLHELNYREKGKLPEVSIVDLREELKKDNRSIFSEKLQELIQDRLDKKQQTMLFINRRGYAGFVSCRDCGEAIKCPHCDVTLKLHRNKKMICHYCGHTEELPKLCPQCGSKYLGGFGIGTQQIETAAKKMFPKARVLRMDADTTSKKGGHEEILSAFANREADILVGTQMIVKGHDFPRVTLVGVIAADMSLYASDYSATETTFQLLCQAAGRAGRSELPGHVVIQTYTPDNYSIETASHQDYKAFYEQEMAYRKLMQYPPASNMVSVLLQSREQKELIQKTEEFAGIIKQYRDKYYNELFVIGPAEPPVAKINDTYRRIIYLKSNDRIKMIKLKNYLEDVINCSQKFNKISVQFDFKA
ncbi:MAG: primosomal protein N' [Eubacterium sp.]|nr:primosomal protein N' [Eubacterium sp.]